MRVTLFCVLFLAALTLNGFAQQSDNDLRLKTFHSISSNELMEFATELSSDKYEGRLSGTPEYLEVAKWCASKFEEFGVKPANGDSYFQYFPNEYSEVNSLGSVVY